MFSDLLLRNVALPEPLCGSRRIEANHAANPEVRHPSALGERVNMFPGAADQAGQFASGPRFRSALDQSDDVWRNRNDIDFPRSHTRMQGDSLPSQRLGTR